MKGKDRRERKEKELPCQVCFLNHYDEDTYERHACTSCDRPVHRNCYVPDLKGKFKCDECKYTKTKDATRFSCAVCGNDREKGLLKNVGNDEWMHVYCALSSPRVKLNSYKTLVFLADTQRSRKGGNKTRRCTSCKSEKAGLPCTFPECANFSHLPCVLSSKYKESTDEYPAFLTIGLLDKHENSLLRHLTNDRDLKDHFKGLRLLKQQKQDTRYFVCQEHNKEDFFNWCICKSEIPDDDSLECESCSRWFHRKCDSFDQHCTGCVKNDIYRKNARLSELVEKAIEVESCSQLDKVHIKYLDHFCLKLSEELLRLIHKQEFEIERYYLRKALENTSNRPVEEEGNQLELLYYLHNKEVKDRDDITPADIEDILTTYSSKNGKYEVKDKSERIEKRFKTYLENQLRALQKDGTQEVKAKLLDLIRKNEEAPRSDAEIAADIFDLIQHLEASEGWKEVYSEFPSSHGEQHLIELFYEMKFVSEDIAKALSAVRTICKAKQRGSISESDYAEIHPFLTRPLLEPKKQIFTSVFKSLLKGLTIRKSYKEKQIVKLDLENKFKCSRSARDRTAIRSSLLDNNLLVTASSPLLQIEKELAELAVLKRMILKKCQDPTPSQLPEAQRLVARLLDIDSRSQTLGEGERREFEQMQHRYAFYQNIYHYAKDNFEMDVESSESDSPMEEEKEESQRNQKIQRPNRSHTIKEWVSNALMDWNLHEQESVLLGLAELDRLVLRGVDFEEKEREMINIFGENVVDYFNRQINAGVLLPTGSLLARLTRIARYSRIQDNYPEIAEMHALYCDWKSDLESKFTDIPAALENSKASGELLKVVEAKMIEGDELDLDVSCELRKLKAVKMWVLLSQKLHPQHKATITAIQNTKSLMDRMSYPNNSLRRRVEVLEAESRSLNKRIGHFLEKAKVGEQEIYEELKVMSAKMTIKGAVELQHDLEVSELDVEVELQELVEEIKQYHSFPPHLAHLADQATDLDHLLQIRRKVFENSFRLESLDGYHHLLVKIIQLKCSEYTLGSPITRKDYYRFLSLAGEAGVELFAETSQLHKAYRDIDRAEKELLCLKPKFELLLPNDCKKIREDLRDDPVETAKVLKWLSASERARERFRTFRNSVHRVEFSQYASIESELLRIPLNNKETLQEISKIRKDIEDLTVKVRASFGDASNPTIMFESPYLEEVLNKYQLIGVRAEFLERISVIYSKNKEIMEIGRNLSPDNYPSFSQRCGEIAELAKNNEVYRMRWESFSKMADAYLVSSDPMADVGYTLLGEGGALLRYPNKANEIIKKITEINQKFYKWQEKSDLLPSMKEEFNSSEQEEVDEEEEEESQDELEGEEEEMLDDSQFQDSSESSSSGRKRARPCANEVVQLDED